MTLRIRFDHLKAHLSFQKKKNDRHGQEKERKYLYALFKKNGYRARGHLFGAPYGIAKQIKRTEKSEVKKKKES